MNILDQETQKQADELRREIAIGLDQLERGQCTDYSDETLAELAEGIKRRGWERMVQKGQQNKS